MGEFFVNDIVHWLPHGEDSANYRGIFERILWVNPRSKDLVVIKMYDDEALPEWKKTYDYESARDNGELIITKLLTERIIPEKELSDISLEKRNKAWEVIKEMVCIENEPNIYYPDIRGENIRITLQKVKCTKTTIYKYLRRFWQGGKTVNALLPRYNNCGAPGKERLASDKKRGRPNPSRNGVNIVGKVKENLLKGFKFYRDEKKLTLRKAYVATLAAYFIAGFEDDGNGNLVPVLLPAEERPSLGQFIYWYYKTRDIKRELIKREGRKRYNQKHREIDDADRAKGPGSKFEIDATFGDIYLVSRLNRKIIGRPIIYTVVDVFSRLVTGLFVTLRHPSWLGAMGALFNATCDKVKFCAEYNIKIDEDAWPCHHLPQLVVADGGEFKSTKPTHLVDSLGVTVEVLPAYRPELKSVIEQRFRMFNIRFIKWAPGAIVEREPGGKDYRYDAALDIHEFTQMLIEVILDYNKNFHIKHYKKELDMIKAKVPMNPIALWKWGIQNRSGALKQYHEDIIRLNLLPSDEATVTERGIRFKKEFYHCELASIKNWAVRAKKYGSWKIPISYDPRLLDVIYYRTDNGQGFIPCTMKDKDSPYLGMTEDEVDSLLFEESHEEQIAKEEEIKDSIKLEHKLKSIVNQAQEKTKKANPGTKRSKVGKGVRENRKEESKALDADQAFKMSSGINNKNITKRDNVYPLKPNEKKKDNYIGRPDYINYEDED